MSQDAERIGFYRKSPAQNRAGFIYLLLRSDGLHKIGCTGNVESRLQSLRVQHKPHTVELIHYFACASMRDAEDGLHRHFAGKRVEGEWFALDESDVAQVLRIKRMGQERKSVPMSVVLPSVEITLIDGRRGFRDAGLEASYEMKAFRLLCNECGRPAYLTAVRDWHKVYSQAPPLYVRMECPSCGIKKFAALDVPLEECEREEPKETPFQVLRCTVCRREVDFKASAKGRACNSLLDGEACTGYFFQTTAWREQDRNND